MKAVVVFVALFAVCLAGELTPELEEKIKKCQEETGVSDEIVKKVKVKELDFDDQKGKCYAKCLCQAKGFCVEDNKLVTLNLHEKKPEISKEKVNCLS